tara:strand:- start:271 stop:522 length:252 start_codon:yes stop_codon:yes gene_type:complete
VPHTLGRQRQDLVGAVGPTGLVDQIVVPLSRAKLLRQVKATQAVTLVRKPLAISAVVVVVVLVLSGRTIQAMLVELVVLVHLK